jgi:hypothetical protein
MQMLEICTWARLLEAPDDRGGVVGYCSGRDAAELAQHEAVADQLLGLLLAPVIEALDDQYAQDDLDECRETPEVSGTWEAFCQVIPTLSHAADVLCGDDDDHAHLVAPRRLPR